MTKYLTESELLEVQRKGGLVGRVKFSAPTPESDEDNPMRQVETLLAEANRRLAVLGDASAGGFAEMKSALTDNLSEIVSQLSAAALVMQRPSGQSVAPLLEQMSSQLQQMAWTNIRFEVTRDRRGFIDSVTAIKEK